MSYLSIWDTSGGGSVETMPIVSTLATSDTKENAAN